MMTDGIRSRSSGKFMPLDQWRQMMNASRLGLRDPRNLGRVMGDPHGAQKNKSTRT